MSIRERRIILRRIAIYVLSVGLCCVLVYYGRIDAPRIWGSLKIVNFLVNSTPTILSILFALFIDKDLEIRTKKRWKIAIVACGVIWSILLWHQQTLADKQSNEQIQGAVNSAVQKSIEHSDQKLIPLQAQVTDLGKNLDITEKTITTALEKTKTDLDSSIGKVGKPEPPELAKLQVSLWKEGQDFSSDPVLSESIPRNSDGSITVQFSVRNISSTIAEEIDVWVILCTRCTYSKDPEGFQKIVGNAEQERAIHISGVLNPGVAYKVFSVTFRSDIPSQQYAIGFRTSCKNCGKIAPITKAMVYVEPSLTPQL
ncbi:MAG: hypothetical protein ABSB30_14440 [Terracidiphilus sp.]|jgi:hypothetical protein